MFGSCRYVVEDLLPRFGIESTLVDGRDLDAWQEAIRPNTRTCFCPRHRPTRTSSISPRRRDRAQGRRAVVVDNVFATPMLQRPLALGADIVVYSATKHIDGQGRCLGGDDAGHQGTSSPITSILFLRQTGPSMIAVQRLGAAEGPGDARRPRSRPAATAAKIADAWRPAKDQAIYYPFRADHPQEELVKKQMRSGSA